MRFTFIAALLIAAVGFVLPTAAHHPGKDLDKVMGSKEKFFQALDKPAPNFSLRDGTGGIVALEDFADKILVLHFVYAGCTDICPLHAEKLADIQTMINQTPMKDMVEFITITTDPSNDTPDILAAYGPAHGFDPTNWRFLTIRPGAEESSTRTLAEAFGHGFIKNDDGYQAHGIVSHIIDRAGRWAANFHSLRFGPVNMVLYINGLSNNSPP
jgi:protein SCO1/2